MRYLIAYIFLLVAQTGFSRDIPIPRINIGIDQTTKPEEIALSLQILFLLTILALVPSIVIMVTSFVRIVIVLTFVKQALTVLQAPPQQVITALALFLTFFIMSPTLEKVNTDALRPYIEKKIDAGTALNLASEPVKDFMLKQTREKDLDLFLKVSGAERPRTPKDVPILSLIPAFMTSELTIAFQIGVLLFLPFLVIDIIVASVLMSMGMIMLPPAMISLPFKILLFVMVDGWNLLIHRLVLSFH
ncbi:TPA: flagellar biosynthetic protein FliP [bacterium]|nr:flagellar biosynthetic protein FliP [bacterium]